MQINPTPVSPAKLALDLAPGEGYWKHEQAVLAAFATEPGVRDSTVTCARCGAVGRPGWAAIAPLGSGTLPPLPRGWSMHNSRPSGDPVCVECFGRALDNVFAIFRAAA